MPLIIDWSKFDWNIDFSSAGGGKDMFIGGRRVSATGVVFKREMKMSDTIQGLSIIDTPIIPQLPDIYDGQALFLPAYEKTVEGSNLTAGEIPIGNTYASANYLIETPVKRAPSFGAGDLIGLDLNIYHDNINYNYEQDLPDMEIYKFNRTLTGLTMGTFGLPRTENVICGSMSFSKKGPTITETFNGADPIKITANAVSTQTGAIYMSAADAYNIIKGDSSIPSSAYGGIGGGVDFEEFKERYADLTTGTKVYLKTAPNKGDKWVKPKKGADFGNWRRDPDYFRPSIDYQFAKEVDMLESFYHNYVVYESEGTSNIKIEGDEKISRATSDNTIFDKIKMKGDFYDGLVTNADGSSGIPTLVNTASAYFTNSYNPPSGQGLSMFTFYDASTDVGGYQYVNAVLRLPKPLELARENGESEEMNSLEVDIKFTIPCLAKLEKTDIGDTNKYGWDMSRSVTFMCATRPPDKNEDFHDYIMAMNGTSDSNNPIEAEAKNNYNGVTMMRHTDLKSNDINEGEVKVTWSGLEGSRSKGWGATADRAYIMKSGADNDTDVTDGSLVDASYTQSIGDDNLEFADGEYYTWKILINNKASGGSNGDIRWVLLDSKDNILATRAPSHVGGSSPADVTNLESGFPAYLSIWVQNVDVDNNSTELTASETGAIYTDATSDTSVHLLIDTISISGFEGKIGNCTVGPRNSQITDFTITSNKESFIDTDGTFTVGEKIPTFEVATPSYLSWGTKTNILGGKTNNIFMGGFNVSNPLFNLHGNTSKSMNVRDSGLGILNADNIFSDIILRIPEHGGTAPKLGSWLCTGADTNLNALPNRNDALLMEGTNYVDDMTKPGFFTIDFSSATDPANYDSRENPAFSTKITEIIDIKEGRIRVQTPSVLAGFYDDEFIIYRNGYAYGNAKYKTGLKCNIDRDLGEILVFNTNLTLADSGATLVHEKYLHELYISPKRFWFVLEVYNVDATSDNAILPDKTYSHSVIQYGTKPSSTILGTTFNESLYSDATASSNKWKVSASMKGGLVEMGTDYGFGSSTDKDALLTEMSLDGEPAIGYIKKYIPKSGYNAVSLDGLVKAEASRLNKPDEKISLYMKSASMAEGSSAIRSTKYSVSDTPENPYFTFYYVDGLPTVNSFTISPNKDDPFYPDFNWKSNDNDLWYGFLLISDAEIKHQYTDAVAVLHLNETDVTSKDNIKLTRYDGIYDGTLSEATAIGNSMETSTEGLAGNALMPSLDSWVTWADNAYTQPTEEFSIVAHFTCDSVASNGYIVGKRNEFDIYVDTSGNVNATLHPDTGTAVTLKSTSVISTDGETPTNVILTLDEGLQSNNVKLFINGKLEDQTGQKNTTGGTHNWTTEQNMNNDTTTHLTVGIKPNLGLLNPRYNALSGTIEEIVLYNKAIYPVIPQSGQFTLTKPISELSTSDIASGITNVVRLFIKDYHNIRGTSATQVASSSNIAYKKAGLGLKTN